MVIDMIILTSFSRNHRMKSWSCAQCTWWWCESGEKKLPSPWSDWSGHLGSGLSPILVTGTICSCHWLYLQTNIFDRKDLIYLWESPSSTSVPLLPVQMPMTLTIYIPGLNISQTAIFCSYPKWVQLPCNHFSHMVRCDTVVCRVV